MTTETYYHLGTLRGGPGTAPIMACGVHLRGSEEGSWDNWNEWQHHQHSYGSAREPGDRQPRCPRCLESEYYGMCVLGELP